MHAERNAINWAAKHGVSTYGTRIYTTLPPCLNCFLDCVTAGVVSFIWLADVEPRSNEEMSLIQKWSAEHNIELRAEVIQ